MREREPVMINGVVAFPDPDGKREIRFIDSSYNELFRIPDGENIVLLTMAEEKQVLPCKYIDDYHAQIGNSTLHICQFAEIMEERGVIYFPEYPQEKDILDIYEIYQIKDLNKTSYCFQSYEKARKRFKREDYERKYRGVLSPKVDKEELFIKHNRDGRPFRDRMHSLSVSDVIVIKRNGEKKAFYIDDFGFREVSKFLKKKIKPKDKREER